MEHAIACKERCLRRSSWQQKTCTWMELAACSLPWFYWHCAAACCSSFTLTRAAITRIEDLYTAEDFISPLLLHRRAGEPLLRRARRVFFRQLPRLRSQCDLRQTRRPSWRERRELSASHLLRSRPLARQNPCAAADAHPRSLLRAVCERAGARTHLMQKVQRARWTRASTQNKVPAGVWAAADLS